MESKAAFFLVAHMGGLSWGAKATKRMASYVVYFGLSVGCNRLLARNPGSRYHFFPKKMVKLDSFWMMINSYFLNMLKTRSHQPT